MIEQIASGISDVVPEPDEVVDNFELLANEIAGRIVANHGSMVRRTTEVADVEQWRKAARRAGRILGVPVRTGVSDDGAKVWVVDAS